MCVCVGGVCPWVCCLLDPYTGALNRLSVPAAGVARDSSEDLLLVLLRMQGGSGPLPHKLPDKNINSYNAGLSSINTYWVLSTVVSTEMHELI